MGADAGYLAALPQNRAVALGSFSRGAGEERRRVAVHEASHAVGALLVGARPRIRLTTRRVPASLRARFAGVVSVAGQGSHGPFIAAMGVAGETTYCRQMGWSDPPGLMLVDDFENMGPHRDAAMESARRALDRDEVWRAVLRLADEIEALWGEDEVHVSADSVKAVATL
jgi:hypothetical protein